MTSDQAEIQPKSTNRLKIGVKLVQRGPCLKCSLKKTKHSDEDKLQSDMNEAYSSLRVQVNTKS